MTSGFVCVRKDVQFRMSRIKWTPENGYRSQNNQICTLLGWTILIVYHGIESVFSSGCTESAFWSKLYDICLVFYRLNKTSKVDSSIEIFIVNFAKPATKPTSNRKKYLDGSVSQKQWTDNVQSNCYNLTSAQNISIFKLMTNVFDVEHRFDVALVHCSHVCRYAPPLSAYFNCLVIQNPKQTVCFYTHSIPNAINFWGRLLSLFNIQQRILFSEYTRINACSYCLCVRYG